MELINNELMELLEFIRGTGKFHILGEGIHSYPNGDNNNKLIHAGCMELEQQGLIYKKNVTEVYTLWLPT